VYVSECEHLCAPIYVYVCVCSGVDCVNVCLCIYVHVCI
jgi:hypothetical protein